MDLLCNGIKTILVIAESNISAAHNQQFVSSSSVSDDIYTVIWTLGIYGASSVTGPTIICSF